METQDKIEDRAEDNQMMDDGEEECGGVATVQCSGHWLFEWRTDHIHIDQLPIDHESSLT